MIDPKILDNLANRLAASLPPGIQELKLDAERNFRAILQATFAKLDLVTREEFDVQSEVLNRTRAKLQGLEEQIMRLETRLPARDSVDDTSQPSHGF